MQLVHVEGPRRGQQEHRVAGHRQGRLALHRARSADLRLADADDLLLVAMIHFDVPAPQVILNELIERQVGIGADQIGRLSIDQLAALARALAERGDDRHAQGLVRSRLLPDAI